MKYNPMVYCDRGHRLTHEPEIGQGNGLGRIYCATCTPEFMPQFMERAAKLFVDYSELRAATGSLMDTVARIGEMRRDTPIPMRLNCPACKTLHVDVGEFATKPHHTHSCQHCGLTWRPAVVATVGVRFLPGFKDGGK